MTETMTADDAKICRIRASDKTRHDADIFERAEATFHALAKQWAESERLRNALAASQQEVERLKGKLEISDTFADAQLTDIGRLRTALAAAREDVDRLTRENALLRASAPLPLPAPTTITAGTGYTSPPNICFDTARSTDAERTHGETR